MQKLAVKTPAPRMPAPVAVATPRSAGGSAAGRQSLRQVMEAGRKRLDDAPRDATDWSIEICLSERVQHMLHPSLVLPSTEEQPDHGATAEAGPATASAANAKPEVRYCSVLIPC